MLLRTVLSIKGDGMYSGYRIVDLFRTARVTWGTLQREGGGDGSRAAKGARDSSLLSHIGSLTGQGTVKPSKELLLWIFR